MALFKIAGDQGRFSNTEKFGDLGRRVARDGSAVRLFEFKSFQLRMPFAYAKSESGVILITHGFRKKKDRTPKEEIERALRIYEEDQAEARLALGVN